MHLYAFSKQSLELLGISILAEMPITMIGERKVPIAPGLCAIGIASEAAAWRQRTDTFEHGLRSRHILQREEVIQGRIVQMNLDCGMFKNSLDLGSKDQAPPCLHVIQRLDSQAIAGNKKFPAARVPYGKPKHS